MPTSSRSAWRRRTPRTLLALAGAGWVLYLVLTLLAHSHGPALDTWLGSGVELLAVTALWLRARVDDGEARAWREFAVGWTCYTATEIAVDVLQNVVGDVPLTALEAGYVVGYLFWLRGIGALLWPHRVQRRSYVLEIATVLVLLAAVIARFVAPPLAHLTGTPLLNVGWWLYLPFGDLIVAACAGVVAAGRGRDHRWWALTAGLTVFAAGDVGYSVVLVCSGGTAVTFGLGFDVAWVGGLVAVAATSWLAPNPRRSTARDGRWLYVLPVVCVPVAAVVLFLVALGRPDPFSASLAFVALVGGVGLLVGGQRELLTLTAFRQAALVDDLTGAANRRALVEAVTARVEAAEPFALALVDLDRFKTVNDSLGHGAGDDLLRQVVARLRATFPADALVARLGGDELAVLLPGPEEGLDTVRAAHPAISGSYTVGGRRIHVGASVGVAVHPRQAETAADLLHVADLALLSAKEGGDRVAGHDAGALGGVRGELLLVEQLRVCLGLDTEADADDHLRAGNLLLHFQPQVRTDDGTVEGAEALVRWQHPDHGLMPPLTFLGLVERHGLMHALTGWVLDEALRVASAWHRDGRGVRVAVNLSATNLANPALPARVSALLHRHHAPVDVLALEITETVAMEGSAGSLAVLREFSEMGLSLSIDDFGTGYSSLGYFRQREFDEVKLDRSFVTGIGTDPRAEAVIVSTIELAHRLGARVVAEGVEDEETLRELTRLGCDLVQGYLHSRPVPAAAFERWCDQRSPSAADDLAEHRVEELLRRNLPAVDRH
ncbi:putative bifunctional diguanylate cyclase/phosphodiesterase [Kineococcus rhizosphaerae]|uniref:Diguanylate cyclase (GGDEF)-like protein n=1 Tax=Kineococcus rhizosphaerae TaxID=559628 RepID=A0A2T0QXU2_9ACTN|nr:bifunctional diguanylate cyclase/phosphodiesterase [Kineococcus rhizosphaerae]PRY10839.1 diguanylate cyclase (GGDEF)-like protein [Kineococcus rhizosphaerae]